MRDQVAGRLGPFAGGLLAETCVGRHLTPPAGRLTLGEPYVG